MAPRIFIFSIAMGADYSFYVKSIAICAPTFFGYIISVLASVIKKSTWWCTIKLYLTYSLQRLLLQNRFQPDINWYSSIFRLWYSSYKQSHGLVSYMALVTNIQNYLIVLVVQVYQESTYHSGHYYKAKLYDSKLWICYELL